MSEARITKLRSVPIFASLDDAVLGRILEAASDFEVPAGHVLLERGMEGAGMFVIEEGDVVVELPEHKITLGPGEFVGELSLLTSAGHTARVRASTAVRGVAIPRKRFTDLLAEEPRIAVPMLEILARRLSAATH